MIGRPAIGAAAFAVCLGSTALLGAAPAVDSPKQSKGVIQVVEQPDRKPDGAQTPSPIPDSPSPEPTEPPRPVPTETTSVKDDRSAQTEELAMGPYAGPDMRAGEVVFLSSLDRDRSAAIATRNGLTIIATDELATIGLTMVTAGLPSGLSLADARDRLNREAAIEWVQPNHVYWLLGNSRESGLAMHGLAGPSADSVTGRIVLIDSPVDTANPALAGARVEQEVFSASPVAAAHGTAIAELLVGSGEFPGVAQGAQLISLAAFSSEGDDQWTTQTRFLAKALDRAVALSPEVANLSFGTRRDDRLVGRLLSELDRSGTCLAAAAGNDPVAGVLFPGRMDATLTVTAVDHGRRIYRKASQGDQVDIAAWGVGMNAAVPGGRRTVSGTSFATALVAGSMLRMPVCNGGRAPHAMRNAVREDAVDLGAPGRDATFGAGLFTLGTATLAPVPEVQAEPANEEVDGSPWRVALAATGIAALLVLLLFAWRRRRREQAVNEQIHH